MPFASHEYYKEAIEYMIDYAKEHQFPFMIDCAVPSFVEKLKRYALESLFMSIQEI